MSRTMKKRIAMLAAVTALAAGPLAPLRAQTVAPAQYVVTYGELAGNPEAQHSGTYFLVELMRLAKNSGAQYFSVNMEIDRRNRFTLVEVWQSAAAYSAFASASNVQQTLRYLQPLLIAPLDERDGNLVIASPTN